jgi:hypothetical protein
MEVLQRVRIGKLVILCVQKKLKKSKHKCSPELKVPGGSKTMQSAAEARTVALNISSR